MGDVDILSSSSPIRDLEKSETLYQSLDCRSEDLKMVSHRTCSDSLSYFLSAFNQVLLGYTLFAIVASVSMEGLINNPSGVETLVDEDYNFEIKTAMERTKNHAAFMMGIVALTFAAVVFLTAEWALSKYKNLNKAAWDVHV